MGAPSTPRSSTLLPLLGLSGACALVCEVVWTRRLALSVGSTGEAVALTLGLYMLGLGLGGGLSGRLRHRRAPRAYGLLELCAAGWTLIFPGLLALLPDGGDLRADLAIAALMLVPPGMLHGATLPAASAALSETREVSALYAVNTLGAVLGALAAPFLLMPTLGLRGTELVAAGGAALTGLVALGLRPADEEADPAARAAAGPRDPVALGAAALSGGVAMALEVAWHRLGALLLGGSVYALAVVLAVFLAGVALGAALGRRAGALPLAMAALAVGAPLGAWLYGALPYGVGLAYGALGDGALLPSGAALLGLAMGAVPVASGAVFSAALARSGGDPAVAAGRVLLANTLGGVVGALGAGLWALPALGVQGLAQLAGALCGGAALLIRGPSRLLRVAPLGLALALSALAPPWDASLYAVGLVHWLDRFADPDPRSVARFAHEGWRLRSYQDGVTATVAVGEGDGGVRWLSVNGKMDASTGADMPTQVMSGRLPVLIAAHTLPDAPAVGLVVGLASGVTAGEALDAGAARLDVVEIEPAVVRAARWFEPQNKFVLNNPDATIYQDDARAWLRRAGVTRRYTFIVSEPSNPWITGVSNLFTSEYWALARARLEQDGVMCQWVQLYALPPEALRGLIRTYLTQFPSTWMFETIPGADALLISAPSLPEGLPIQPTLGPEGLALLAGRARLNTDDDPWVEFEAPRWLLRSTGALNQEIIAEAAARSGGR